MENCCAFNEARIFSSSISPCFPSLPHSGVRGELSQELFPLQPRFGGIYPENRSPICMHPFLPPLGNPSAQPQGQGCNGSAVAFSYIRHVARTKKPKPLLIPCPASLYRPQPGNPQPSSLHPLLGVRAGRGRRATPKLSLLPLQSPPTGGASHSPAAHAGAAMPAFLQAKLLAPSLLSLHRLRDKNYHRWTSMSFIKFH